VIYTVVLVVVLGILALAVSMLFSRRTPDAPSTPLFAAPTQLDRRDFAHPDTDWLMVLFTSATCTSCRSAREVVLPLGLEGLAVQEVEHPGRRDLHDRYRIDSVPTVVVADIEGVVAWSHVGAPPSMAIVQLIEDLGLVPPSDETSVALPG
jgi:hypothetical protein